MKSKPPKLSRVERAAMSWYRAYAACYKDSEVWLTKMYLNPKLAALYKACAATRSKR